MVGVSSPHSIPLLTTAMGVTLPMDVAQKENRLCHREHLNFSELSPTEGEASSPLHVILTLILA